MPLKFPYGISDFARVITQDYLYIDRTDRIPLIEAAGDQLVFLRPRRFGKSLLLSMLEHYYDIARADQFEALFGQLAIGRAPTPLHNRYLVLRWDFSAVGAGGDSATIESRLNEYLNDTISLFADYYAAFLKRPIQIVPHNPLSSFRSLLGSVFLSPHRLYLLIDEYDNFANEMVFGQPVRDQARYEALLHGGGMVKGLFKAIKAASAGGGLERVFITGVSPMVLSDISSGYNVATDIFLNPKFNDLCGFQEHEVAEIIQNVVASCGLPPEQAETTLETVRTFYNGYCFHRGSTPCVYNPTLVFYFARDFKDMCGVPQNMLDHNLAMDQNKLRAFAQMPSGRALVFHALSHNQPIDIESLAERYTFADLLAPAYDRELMGSLLYYFGVLTISGRTPFQKTRLTIPNLVTQRLFVTELQALWLPDNQDLQTAKEAAEILYSQGELAPLCTVIEQHILPRFDNRDYRWANELTIKTAFLTLLFNDQLYLLDSEAPLDRGYADLVLRLRPELRQHRFWDLLLEFKYLPLTELKLSGQEIRALSQEALHTLPIVSQALDEAAQQAHRYQAQLNQRHGATLHLRTFAVVALGFDRLVWRCLA